MKATHERLTEGNGGWVRYQSDVLPVPVFVRLEDRGGRLVLADLFLPAPTEGGGLDTTLLRAVPTARIEAWANTAGVAEGIRARLRLPGPDLRRAASYFSTTFGSRARPTWVTRMLKAQVPGSGEQQAKMLDLAEPMTDPLELLARVDAELDKAARLPTPTGRNYGDHFYQAVATAYSLLAQNVTNPVTTLAEANEVPLSTVQRWVREARRRGYLSAARPGKRG